MILKEGVKDVVEWEMKLLDLLEGSDKLFHLTKLTNLSDMLVSGGLLCSTMKEKEDQRVRSRLGIEGKIFI